MKNNTAKAYKPNYSHAWRGSWDRPMLIDENALHPFTVARMTNHSVRGIDKPVKEKKRLEVVDVDAQRHPEEQIPLEFDP